MIPSLAPGFTGSFQWYKDGLALPGEHPTTLSGRDLLDGGIADELLRHYAKTFPGADRRAIVSMWTQWHFGILIVPATAAILLLDRELPLELDHVSIALNGEGRTAAIVLPDDGREGCVGEAGRFSRLFEGHIEPLVEHFADRFRVSRRLLWANAAATFEWALEQAEALNPSQALLNEGRALLECRTDAKGRPNPMHGMVLRCEDEGTLARRRKVCCLRYLLPGFEDCGSLCPLAEAKIRKTNSSEDKLI
ncbi:siderophore-iron reductase FhuF [Microvirga sp. KLBC 81]|uniref:siderophore-iron reductase FhuF n=1 Tax=Microvirga sp. KLBC 81 TaxID=1862707 RepID=UPI000D50C374|nr:siderophore-iron reductase FhuF [Microvirga sp. KLBC 81]PVE26033.1 siderophore-iron reductase FhuF [Microvirga sp. KLBC 81]